MKKGSRLAANIFIAALEKGVSVAVLIISYHLSRLEAHKGEGAWQLAMYNDFLALATEFINIAGTKGGDLETQVMLTKIFESVFKDLPGKLDELDSLTRDIHPVNSDEYNLIWGRNRNRFYEGTYADRIGALFALATEMTTQGVPLGAAAALDCRTEIMAKQSSQRTRMTKVGNDAIRVDELRTLLSRKLYKNMGGLIFNFGDLEDCEEKVKKYYPLNLLGDHFQHGHYQFMVALAELKRVCIHLPKKGEQYYILVTGGDALIGSADNADYPITSGYLAKDGVGAYVDPEQIGDLTKKVIVVLNKSLTSSVDLIFNIIKAK